MEDFFMRYTEREVLQFVEENDVKFVKLMFCDVFGNLKAISVLSGELPKIFRCGYAFDATQMDGFMGVYESDLVLKPILDTLSLLPWRPQQGRVMRLFCCICCSDGTPFAGDARHYLADAASRAKKAGIDFKIGTSCEFYVFELDEKGLPTKIPHDTAGCCDVAPADRGENLRRDICMTLEQMEIYPESSRHEAGPGQNEIDFVSSAPLKAGDNLVTFKNTVKSVAGRNGLYATFMPKPLPDKSGSSLQITLNCMKNGADALESKDGSCSRLADRMIGGLLKNLPAMTMFLNGITNSYSRMESLGAMRYVSWTKRNLNNPIRLKKTSGGMSGITLRTPDNTCNPYLAMGLIINACMDGVENDITAGEPVETDIASASAEERGRYEKLPATLSEAVDAAEESAFIKANMPTNALEYMLAKKKAMCADFDQAQNKEIYETVKFFYTL